MALGQYGTLATLVRGAHSHHCAGITAILYFQVRVQFLCRYCSLLPLNQSELNRITTIKKIKLVTNATRIVKEHEQRHTPPNRGSRNKQNCKPKKNRARSMVKFFSWLFRVIMITIINENEKTKEKKRLKQVLVPRSVCLLLQLRSLPL